MKRGQLRFAGAVLAGGLCFGGRAPAGPPEPPPEFVVPDDLEVTVWAESPRLFNPTNIDVDARGRVWVAEGMNYRLFRHPGDPPPRPEGDRIVILEDTDGDGKCDSSKVFVQDKDLISPLGVCVLGKRVIVSCSPSAFVYTDEDGDDKPDKKEILLTGFGGHDHDHGLHSFTAGPDGRLYFAAGNAGPHIVTDKSGWTLRSGSIYTDGGPNQPGLKSDDGRVWTGGLILRCNPDGSHLEVLAHNFRNNYEVAVDSFGNLWSSDNDDQVQACRATWVMEGSNQGYFSSDGSRSWDADRRLGQSIPTAHWHQEDPGVVPAGEITGAGAPAGIAVYEGELLPERYRGMVLLCDPGRNTVFGMIPHPDGAGYKLEPTLFLTSRREKTDDYVWDKVSEDKRTWFRPSDVAVGTDGAVYVADWYDPIVGGHDMKDTKGWGRILRIAPKGSRPKAPKIDVTTEEGAVQALCSPAVNVRNSGLVKLHMGPGKHPSIPWDLRKSPNRFFRARAVWFLGRRMELRRDEREEAVSDDDPDVRTAIYRAFYSKHHLPLMWWLESAFVRREWAIRWREEPKNSNSHENLSQLISYYDGRDRWYLEALGIACEEKADAIYPHLLAQFGDPDPLKWSDPFAGIVWRLHPVAAVPALVARAKAESLPFDARKQALDAIAFCFHADAANAMVDLALNGPEAIRPHALWWARFRADKEWKAFGIAAKLPPDETPDRAARRKRVAALRGKVIGAETPPAGRESAALELAATPEGGNVLLRLADTGKLPKELQPKVAEAIYKNPDPGVRAMASRVFPRPAKGGATFPPVAELLKMKGDAAHGKELFHGTANCAKCHTFAGVGSDVGPDLTAIRGKLGREAIVDAILNPSASIALGFEPWVVVTKDEQVFTGFIIADGEMVIIKDTTGTRHAIPAKEIAERKRQTTSIMPDNIALGLTPQELVDIVEFLTAAQ